MTTDFTKRPFATAYFTNVEDGVARMVTHGSCTSVRNAIRAGIVRLYDGQYNKFMIVDRESGAVVTTFIRTPERGIHEFWGRR